MFIVTIYVNIGTQTSSELLHFHPDLHPNLPFSSFPPSRTPPSPLLSATPVGGYLAFSPTHPQGGEPSVHPTTRLRSCLNCFLFFFRPATEAGRKQVAPAEKLRKEEALFFLSAVVVSARNNASEIDQRSGAGSR